MCVEQKQRHRQPRWVTAHALHIRIELNPIQFQCIVRMNVCNFTVYWDRGYRQCDGRIGDIVRSAAFTDISSVVWLAGWIGVRVYDCDAVSIGNWIKQSQTAFTLINIKFFCIALTRTCTVQIGIANWLFQTIMSLGLSFHCFIRMFLLRNFLFSQRAIFLCVSMNTSSAHAHIQQLEQSTSSVHSIAWRTLNQS